MSEIYEYVTKHGVLSDKHWNELKEKRGFNTKTITENRFFSGSQKLTKIDFSQFKEESLLESGVFIKNGRSAHINPQLLDESKIIIPYLDNKGSAYHLRPHKLGFKDVPIKIYHTKTIGDPLIITEGEFKAAAAVQLGYNAIAIPGISSFSGKHFDELVTVLKEKHVKRIAIMFDNEVKDDPKLTNYKEDVNVRYDTQFYSYYMAKMLVEQGFKTTIATLPSAWMENGKIDIDGALAQGRSVGEFNAILNKSLLPDKYLESMDDEAKRIIGRKYFIASRNGKFNELELALYLKEAYLIIYADSGIYYRYVDGYYQYTSENTIIEIISKDFGCIKNNFINLCVRYLKAHTEIRAKELNQNKYINLQNGLFDIEKYELLPHTPEVLSTIRLNVTYDKNAICPKWENAVQTIVDNYGNIKIIQEFFGLCLTRETYDRALFITGEGNNGKSTLLEVLKYIVGDENISEIPLDQFEKDYYIAQLHTKLLNISAETGAKNSVCDYIFKQIVTHDSVTVSHKYGHPFTFRPACKLLFATNTMPRTDDKSNAFFRRLLIVKLEKVFTENDEQHKYFRELIDEANGIFNWMITGLKRLVDRSRFEISKDTIEAIEEYRRENNPIITFVEECCAVDTEHSISKRELYEKYVKFCEESGFRSMHINNFARELKRYIGNSLYEFQSADRTKRERMWSGIELKDENLHGYGDNKDVPF